MERTRARVGISACLLGQEVRYDGGHKHEPGITEALGRLFEWVPVCPEVELGLGVPREALRLEGPPGDPRLVFSETRRDITGEMSGWARRRLEELERLDLCGYVLKTRSPSCGLGSAPVFESGRADAPSAPGSGLFARALRDRFPGLPVEEEERLRDTAARDEFVEHVARFARLKGFA